VAPSSSVVAAFWRPVVAGVVNGGGIRANLRPGPLRYGDFHDVFPFDNRFARLVLTGAELRALIADDLQGERGSLTFSGIRGRAACSGTTIAVTLERDDGRPIGDEERLVVVTSDYLATSSIPVFATANKDGRVTIGEGELMRDALVAARKIDEGKGAERL
jgi:2',3'-cyclic-nucleotide 2'-phosphodiesterase (5'-nucleotidase family)